MVDVVCQTSTISEPSSELPNRMRGFCVYSHSSYTRGMHFKARRLLPCASLKPRVRHISASYSTVPAISQKQGRPGACGSLFVTGTVDASRCLGPSQQLQLHTSFVTGAPPASAIVRVRAARCRAELAAIRQHSEKGKHTSVCEDVSAWFWR